MKKLEVGLGAKCIAELVREAAASADMTVQLWAAGIEPVPEEMRGVRYGAEFIWNARGVAGIASTILNNQIKNWRTAIWAKF
jgi:hypothetical protein